MNMDASESCSVVKVAGKFRSNRKPKIDFRTKEEAMRIRLKDI